MNKQNYYARELRNYCIKLSSPSWGSFYWNIATPWMIKGARVLCELGICRHEKW